MTRAQGPEDQPVSREMRAQYYKRFAGVNNLVANGEPSIPEVSKRYTDFLIFAQSIPTTLGDSFPQSSVKFAL
jgi:hypothetical protein